MRERRFIVIIYSFVLNKEDFFFFIKFRMYNCLGSFFFKSYVVSTFWLYNFFSIKRRSSSWGDIYLDTKKAGNFNYSHVINFNPLRPSIESLVPHSFSFDSFHFCHMKHILYTILFVKIL